MWARLKSLFFGKSPARQLFTSEDATSFIGDLFRAHGLECGVISGWIVPKTQEFIAQARVFVHDETSRFSNVQLDFDVRTTDHAEILESCGGFGKTRPLAIADAMQNMANGSFHVLYSALTQQPCSHCEIEKWTIDGIPRTVYVGPMVTRSNQPTSVRFPTEWFASLKTQIESRALDQKIHWIRLYHMQMEKGESISECLIDNQPDEALQSTLHKCDWPTPQGFYSVRVFLMIAKSLGSSH